MIFNPKLVKMQFVKTIVDSIGCAGGDANTDNIINNIEQYHYRIWKHFSLMPIQKLSETKESPSNGGCKIGASQFSSPKSLMLPSTSSIFDRSSLNKDFIQFRGLNYKKVYKPSSQQENVFLALNNYKSSMCHLEHCIFSSVPDPDYEKTVNIDKVSGLLEKADHLVTELKEELVNKFPSVVATKEQLDGILKTLQTNSTSIENATIALKSLSQILTDHFHECINLIEIDELLLTLAKQLRIYWLVHFPNHQTGTIFESQLEQFIEAIFTVLNDICPMRSKEEILLMSNVSLGAYTMFLESLLPYLAVINDQNGICLNSNPVLRSRNLIYKLESSLIVRYSLKSGSFNDSLQVRVTIALLRLLKKYSLQAINKPATDLPPLDFPAIYANALNKQFDMLNCCQSILSRKLFLNHTAIFLLEIYELFEVYSGIVLSLSLFSSIVC